MKYRWEFIGPSGELSEVAVKGDLVVDADSAMIRAAESGLGIAFVYQSLVTQQLSAGSPSICYPTTAILPTILRLLPKPETYSRPCGPLSHG